MMSQGWNIVPRMGVATGNVCGLMAKSEDGWDRRLRRSKLLCKLQQHAVHLASVQETHFNSVEEIASQQFWVRRQGYDMRAMVAAAFGSVVVPWAHSQWTELSTTINSPRLMIVELRHTTG